MAKTDLENALNHKYRVYSDGEFVPGVTSVIGIIDKPALKWAAAKIAAQTAVENIHEMTDVDEYVHRCRGEFDRLWREKAKRGNRVHDVAERWARGETVEVAHADQGFVDALAAFYSDHSPVTVLAERVIIHPLMRYGGRFDAIVEMDGGRFLIDYKTGGHYPVDVAMQASAYMRASLAHYDAAGNIGHFSKLPELDGARIIYLTENGTYEVVDPFETIALDDAFDAFTSALVLYRSIKTMEKLTKGKK